MGTAPKYGASPIYHIQLTSFARPQGGGGKGKKEKREKRREEKGGK